MKNTKITAAIIAIIIMIAALTFLGINAAKAEETDPFVGEWYFKVLLAENITTGGIDDPDYYPSQRLIVNADGTVQNILDYLGNHTEHRYENYGVWTKLEDGVYGVIINHPWDYTDIDTATINEDGELHLVEYGQIDDDTWVKYTTVFVKT